MSVPSIAPAIEEDVVNVFNYRVAYGDTVKKSVRENISRGCCQGNLVRIDSEERLALEYVFLIAIVILHTVILPFGCDLFVSLPFLSLYTLIMDGSLMWCNLC